VPQLFTTLALLGLTLLLGATAYESVVMAPNYERDIPDSLSTARRFLVRTTPAHYFRVVAPITLIVLLIDVIVSWRVPYARTGLVTGFVALAVGDAITFAFHYPRLDIMFKQPLGEDAVRLRKAAREWALGNIVRAVLLVVAFLAVLHAFAMIAGGTAIR
jgi:uncharacterized membrane protein